MMVSATKSVYILQYNDRNVMAVSFRFGGRAVWEHESTVRSESKIQLGRSHTEKGGAMQTTGTKQVDGPVPHCLLTCLGQKRIAHQTARSLYSAY